LAAQKPTFREIELHWLFDTDDAFAHRSYPADEYYLSKSYKPIFGSFLSEISSALEDYLLLTAISSVEGSFSLFKADAIIASYFSIYRQNTRAR
jgi:hypothetical protein